jgi:hypothetical protein
MNPQIKQKWVSALRSGEYQQGQLYLRTNSGFCCLGVLCDLYGKENNVEWNLVEDEDSNYYRFQGNAASLPFSIVEWSGIEGTNPAIGFIPLSVLNDRGSTFNEIADVIEEHF